MKLENEFFISEFMCIVKEKCDMKESCIGCYRQPKNGKKFLCNYANATFTDWI